MCVLEQVMLFIWGTVCKLIMHWGEFDPTITFVPSEKKKVTQMRNVNFWSSCIHGIYPKLKEIKRLVLVEDVYDVYNKIC